MAQSLTVLTFVLALEVKFKVISEKKKWQKYYLQKE